MASSEWPVLPRSGWRGKNRLLSGWVEDLKGGYSLDALFGRAVLGHSGVVAGLCPFLSAPPLLPLPPGP